MGEPDHREANLSDLVGEVANTFSGNAREHFGPDVAISVPVTVKGRPERANPDGLDFLPYVITVGWKSHSDALMVCVEDALS